MKLSLVKSITYTFLALKFFISCVKYMFSSSISKKMFRR